MIIASSSGASRVILVVDDFPDGAEAMCRILRITGYPCQWASSGQEALAKIRAHPPEQPLLVVLDEMMPEMSGIEVLRQIRADPRIANTTVVFHSAGFDLAKRDEAMTLGAAAWLLKGGSGATDVARVIETIGDWYQRVGGVPERSQPWPDAQPSPLDRSVNDHDSHPPCP